MADLSTTHDGRSLFIDFLVQKINESSFRGVEEKTGVSKGALENLTKGRNRKLPELETLAKIAEAYSIPRWKVIEMTGFYLDLDQESLLSASRISSFVQKNPDLSSLIDEITKMHPDDIRGVLIYMEVTRRLREERV